MHLFIHQCVTCKRLPYENHQIINNFEAGQSVIDWEKEGTTGDFGHAESNSASVLGFMAHFGSSL